MSKGYSKRFAAAQRAEERHIEYRRAEAIRYLRDAEKKLSIIRAWLTRSLDAEGYYDR